MYTLVETQLDIGTFFYESKMAENAGTPLASRSYTVFVENFLLLITHTASAPLSFHILYASSDVFGLP